MNLFNTLQIIVICASCVAHQDPPNVQVSTSYQSELPLAGASHPDLYLPLLQDKSVACVVNHSSRIHNVHLVDSLKELGVNVKVIFAPEHGIRGTADAGAHMENGKDPSTGIPVISLYGDRKKPARSDLAGIDVVLFDIQDVGVRFYTYISTMHLVMEACAENGIPMIILDRPNPNGYYIDGPVLKPAFRSFVGMHPIPVVYGMTIGELAGMINDELWLENGVQCDLVVIPCTSYDHTMTYVLPVAPSPNLPNLRSILLYPSLCFFEGTQVSVGRGTDVQFQVLGHPEYGVGSYTFTPEPRPGAMQPLYQGIHLYGTNLTGLTVDEIRKWKRLNLTWLLSYHRFLSPHNNFFPQDNDFFDKLAGTDALRTQLEAGWTEAQIRASWEDDLRHFKEIRKKYLLYPDFVE